MAGGAQRFRIYNARYTLRRSGLAVHPGLVVYVDRSVEDETSIRIISARQATEYEQRIYQDQFR